MKAQEFKIGQIVTLKSGWTGEVVTINHKGHYDIRPPHHRCGYPTLKGINGNLGYIDIIPDEWEILYGGEVNESQVQTSL